MFNQEVESQLTATHPIEARLSNRNVTAIKLRRLRGELFMLFGILTQSCRETPRNGSGGRSRATSESGVFIIHSGEDSQGVAGFAVGEEKSVIRLRG